MSKLSSSKLLKLCGVGLQGCLDTCLEFMDTLLSGNAPQWCRIGSVGIASKLQHAFGTLCQHVDEISDSGQAHVIYGERALTAKWDDLQVQIAGSKDLKVTYTMLREFRQFAWLLTKLQADGLRELTATAVDEAPGKRKAAAPADKSRSTKREKKDDSVAMVSKLFEN